MKLTRLALAGALALISYAATAESVIRPVPIPDFSKIGKAEAAELVEMRAEFDRSKATLVGEQLAKAYSLLASSYAQAGFYAEADVALANAIVVTPDDARWIYLRGMLAQMRNQTAQANDFLEQALRLDRKYVPMRVAVAEARLAGGNVDGARQVVDQAGAEGKDNAMLASLRARIALRQGRHADALSALNEALRLDPGANQLYGVQAEIYTAQGNKTSADAARAKAGTVAVRQLDPLLAGFLGVNTIDLAANAQQPGTPAANQDDPLTRARFLIGVQQFDAARAPLDEALRAKPNDSGLLSLSARIEALLGNRTVALARANDAVRLSPNDAAALVTRGVVAETGGDEAAAQADYEKAISLDANLIEARLLLGNRFMRINRYAQAAEQYRQLIRLEPKVVEHHGRLAAAQVSDGRCTEALRDLEASLKANQRQGYAAQVFVRVSSTCRGTTEAQRKTAADYARRLYIERPIPQVIEAVALANAAEGKFTVAAEMQGSAMFAAVRDGGNEAADPFREFFKKFQASQMPDKPWPADSGLFRPARLQPQASRPAPAAQPASARQN
ncbi:MAG TPA: tetratricopeptide repeat protein [Tahibacter sp.]|uniref:tetratricopeptide repeat protein n=1 Tax=Tahibacter sp. TaxID=2056211 RepID=UPI002CFF20A8|nr:tetratricopeptide repeat protein [Tahibacter sp.]HSX61918.1 tetratricopeptide repeat protein [Tahibacter sp.]